MRFTIWCGGCIQGTYAGADEAEALDALASEGGYSNFADRNKQLNLTRDDYRVKAVSQE